MTPEERKMAKERNRVLEYFQREAAKAKKARAK